MPGNKQKAGQFLSLEASSWISLSELWSFTLTVFKEIILINITQKIYQITANQRPHYHWNNQSIFCAVLSTSSYPCICTHFATCLLCFSLLEQPPKEVNKQVLELVERRGQDCMTMTMRERSKTESFHSHSGLSDWLCTYDWTTDPLSPRKGRSRVAPCHHKKVRKGRWFIPSSAARILLLLFILCPILHQLYQFDLLWGFFFPDLAGEECTAAGRWKKLEQEESPSAVVMLVLVIRICSG